MLLSKKELALCLYARGYQEIRGFQNIDPDFSEKEQEAARQRLMQHPFFEKPVGDEAPYHFSALGQVFLDTMGASDAWIEVQNDRTATVRRFYIRDAYYVFSEDRDEFTELDLLPSLPLLIGGYASALSGLYCDEPMDQNGIRAAWESGAPFIHVAARCGNKELRLAIGDNGIAQHTDGDEETYRQFTEESCTNTITMWLLNSLKERGDSTDA